MVLESDFGFKMIWDGQHLVNFYVENTDVVTGICYGHSKDDISSSVLNVKPRGTINTKEKLLSALILILIYLAESCSGDVRFEEIDYLSMQETTSSACETIGVKSADNPFVDCFKHINPQAYIEVSLT